MHGQRRRRGMRSRLRHPVFFETADQKGAAMLTEMSYSGARIEAVGIRITRGEVVRLYVWAPSQPEPFDLVGTVASVGEDGFAVEYVNVGQQLCQWVDALRNETVGDASTAPGSPAD